MKKLIILLLGLGAAGILAMTNPTLDDYQNFIRQEVIRESQKSNDALAHLGRFLGGFAGAMLASQTIRDDYVFFSIYELPFGTKRLRLLGLCKRFIVLESPR